jgi:hypothetical protein
MILKISEAAQHVGRVKSSVLRAIRNGKITAVRDDDGNPQGEPLELFRAFEPVAAPPLQPQQFESSGAVVALLREQLAETRKDRDHWRDIAQRLASPATRSEAIAMPPLPLPPPPKSSLLGRFLRWCRAG